MSRPLELPRHWRRNTGRLVAVRLCEGDTITGRIVSNSEDDVRLDVDGESREIRFVDVDRALVQVELNPPQTGAQRGQGGLRWTSTSPCCG